MQSEIAVTYFIDIQPRRFLIWNALPLWGTTFTEKLKTNDWLTYIISFLAVNTKGFFAIDE